MSELERTLAFHLKAHRLPEPLREYRFAPPRNWRFDFAWPEQMLAVEVEGGTWNGGRHTRGDGFERDCTKYNEAALAGWRLLRFTTSMVTDGRAIAVIERALSERRQVVG